MYGKTLKSNDALRLEFIRSVIRNVSDEQDRGVVQAILLAFIKGSARTRLAASDEAVLHAYLRDLIDTRLKSNSDDELLVHDLAALAKHVADTEAARVAAYVASLRDQPEKAAANSA